GLKDQADALAGLPIPNAYRSVDGLGIGWDSGGAQGQEESPDDPDGPGGGGSQNEQAPAGPGLASSVVANCHQITVCGEVEAAGIAPASRDPSVSASTCVSGRLVVGVRAPIGKVPFGLSRHVFNPSRNGRVGTGDPALAPSR